MSLFPITSTQRCSKCNKLFVYNANTLDVPLGVRCDNCNFTYFKGYKNKSFFLIINPKIMRSNEFEGGRIIDG